MKRNQVIQLAALAALVAGGLVLTLRIPQQPANVLSVMSSATGNAIEGEWQSEQDAAYAVSFRSGGLLTETYDGEQVSSGTFHFADSAEGYSDLPTEPAGENAFLLQDIDGERYAYRVTQLSATRLELSYLERGNTLSFIRR